MAIRFYSVLKLFTGLAIAAFMAFKLTEIKAIVTAPNPTTAKIHHAIVIR
jgi:hypothetical protein